MPMWKRCVALAGLIAAAWMPPASAADSAVVLAYHRFGDDRLPAANTRIEQLEAQIAELKRGGYAVLPLSDIVAALRAGKPLPDKAVAITVDEAATGLYSLAWPLLRQAGLPFTVFVATDEADRATGDALGWDRIREMAAGGATIATQGAARTRLARLGRAEVAAELERARARFAKEIGRPPALLAWPHGETSAEAEAAARAAGFDAAFGQHSGAVWGKADPYYLPRFAINETYGEAERFRMAVRSLPLRAEDVTPADPVVAGANPPSFGFTLAEEVAGIDALYCFSSHEGRLKVERLGPRIEVRMVRPLPAGRTRLNCTMPTLEGRWRWFGWQFSVN